MILRTIRGGLALHKHSKGCSRERCSFGVNHHHDQFLTAGCARRSCSPVAGQGATAAQSGPTRTGKHLVCVGDCVSIWRLRGGFDLGERTLEQLRTSRGGCLFQETTGSPGGSGATQRGNGRGNGGFDGRELKREREDRGGTTKGNDGLKGTGSGDRAKGQRDALSLWAT
jgi:hypothetical protein